ncbi:hypothetical protein EVAR_103395_1 [Eumeta japonica]|uniref:Uncharacterized protein n=1 Tax=Eumeta variegata TaxID=151549 RepID=A0A4C1YVJ1_EUMVA|nr:hypothetical protein EVAR_103395_1 [Eumeta japonica]
MLVFFETGEVMNRLRCIKSNRGRATRSLPGEKSPQGVNTSKANRKKPKVSKDPKIAPTKTQKGEAYAPAQIPTRRRAALEDAEATINDNDSQTNLRGKMNTIHMAAYSVTRSLVNFYEEQTERTENLKYIIIPLYDPIVVTARCTKLALEKRIVEIANFITISKASCDA